jgi:hypothetical protein
MTEAEAGILVAGEGILVVAQAAEAEEDTPAEEGGIMVTVVVEAEDIMGIEAVMAGEADKEEGDILIRGCPCLPNPL